MKFIEKISREIQNKLGKNLISLYVAGSILRKEDRTPHSDIDFFGIVNEAFDMKKEDEINRELKRKIKTLCGGYEAKFRAIGMDELQGGKPRGVLAKHRGLGRILKPLSHSKRVYGKNLDFSKFPAKPWSLKKEAYSYIKEIDRIFNNIKNKKEEKFKIQNIPKLILYLAEIESEKKGYKHTSSYREIAKRFNKCHISRKALAMRYLKITRKDIVDFYDEAKKYASEMKKEIKCWKNS